MSTPSLDWNRIRTCRVVVPTHVVHRTLASETVLLNISTGVYYGMDPVGARFFEVCRSSRDMKTALQKLVEEFDAPEERIRADMLRYIGELADRGLVLIQEPRA